MGWDFCYFPESRERMPSTHEYVSAELPSLEFLAHGMSGGTYYAAVREPNGPAFAAVVLVKRGRDARGRYIGTKIMDEGMGPHECEAPLRVLRALDAPNNDYARDWRERAWAHAKANAFVAVGMIHVQA